MALITHTIPNLMNGVSQQPITIRLDNQAEEQINAMARVSDGLSKRMPMAMISAQKYTETGSPFADLILADDSIKMHMIRGVDSAGVTRTCQLLVDCLTGSLAYKFLEAPFSSGLYANNDAYLQASGKSSIKFLTNGDTTYILNKDVIVELDSALDVTQRDIYMIKQGSLCFVKSGFFGTTYTAEWRIINRATGAVFSGPHTATYTTNSSSATTNLTELQTTQIANDGTTAPTKGLSASLEVIRLATPYLLNNTEIIFDDNWFQVKWKDASLEPNDYRIEMKCTATTAETAIFAINGVTTDAIDLPKTGPEGYVTKIDADPTSIGDQYYLKYTAEVNGWIECPQKVATPESFDTFTLPYKVINIIESIETPSAFSFAHMDISPREAGDHETSPDPSFVGHRMNDMFIFNNRLGFLSQNNVIMSRIDEFETFFRTSTAVSLSADRVDLKAAVPSTRYTDLHSAVPFETAIMLFGDAAQYVLNTTTGFDVTKTSLQTSTEYEASRKTAPVNLGSSVYFPVTRGAYSGIFDLSRKDGIGLTAEEATHHVPTYISGEVVEMTYSSVENILFARTATDKRTIYVQNRFIRQSILEQNSWHKWVVPNDLLYINILGSKLFICMVADDGISIIRTSIDISTNRITQDETLVIGFTPFLDYVQLIPQGTVLTIDDYATYFIPSEHELNITAVNENGSITLGLADINAALVDEDLWVGIPYDFAYTFSQQVPFIEGSNGQRTVYQYGRLSLRSMKVSFSNTGKFDVLIEPTGRASHTSYFTGTILGSLSALLGRINIASGVFKFPVNSRANEVVITIKSSYPYPLTLNTVEWQGMFTNNSGRM